VCAAWFGSTYTASVLPGHPLPSLLLLLRFRPGDALGCAGAVLTTHCFPHLPPAVGRFKFVFTHSQWLSLFSAGKSDKNWFSHYRITALNSLNNYSHSNNLKKI